MLKPQIWTQYADEQITSVFDWHKTTSFLSSVSDFFQVKVIYQLTTNNFSRPSLKCKTLPTCMLTVQDCHYIILKDTTTTRRGRYPFEKRHFGQKHHLPSPTPSPPPARCENLIWKRVFMQIWQNSLNHHHGTQIQVSNTFDYWTEIWICLKNKMWNK